MCLSKAWFKGESTGKAIMENIVKIKIEDGKVILSSLFGEERIEKATVEEVDFTRSSIILNRD
ncbi:MAG: CooT family nickel-binding protein [Chloroflexota bacterium]